MTKGKLLKYRQITSTLCRFRLGQRLTIYLFPPAILDGSLLED
jgi:hypothetical protein